VTRCSVSQLCALGKWAPPVRLFAAGQENVKGAKPISSGWADPKTSEIFCGKPTIVRDLGYATLLSDIFLHMRGPDTLSVHIPFEDLPLTLEVYDTDDVTNPSVHNPDDPQGATFNRSIKSGIPVLPVHPGTKPHVYRLVDPTGTHSMARKGGRAANATLVISKSRQIGSGLSARVYEAQIGLEIEEDIPEEHRRPGVPPIKKFPPKLLVVAKVGTSTQGAEQLLNEARMFNTFPPHFSREYTGFQLVKPSHFARRLSQIVPHYYGFYQPVDAEIVGQDQKRAPIILMEDCGAPVDPDALTQYQKYVGSDSVALSPSNPEVHPGQKFSLSSTASITQTLSTIPSPSVTSSCSRAPA